MELTVHRLIFTPESTQGSLDIDGVFECFTLEPRKDQSQGKPYCIPCGTFPVILGWSNHFQRIMPHILNIPDYTDVEIHPLNWPYQTEACLGVGRRRGEDAIWESDLAFEALMLKLKGQKNISITYQEELAGPQSV